MKVPDREGHFVVVINASRECLGGVLMQDGRFISYEYRKLKSYDQNYAPHDLELVAIIHDPQMWQHYLLANPLNSSWTIKI